MKQKRSRSSTNNYRKSKRMKRCLENQQVVQFPESQSSLRFAIVLSYLGTRYNGLQFLLERMENKDLKGKSIENVLIRAMEKAGYMPTFKDKVTRRACNLLRACRTDKGVHAASNIVGVRVPADLIWSESFKAQLETESNDDEVDDDLQEDAMRDDEFDQGKENVLNQNGTPIIPDSKDTVDLEDQNPSTVSPIEVSSSENVPSVASPSERNPTENIPSDTNPIVESSISLESNAINGPHQPMIRKKRKGFIPSAEELHTMREKLNEKLPTDIQVVKVIPAHGSYNPRKHTQARYYRYLLPKSSLIYKEPDNLLLKRENNSKVTEENQKETLERIFKTFEGVHSYHNFTDQVKPGQSEAFRKIYSITIPEVIETDFETFYVIQLHGQSFLYHQIRMIMAATICVCRGLLQEEDIEKAFDTKLRLNLPIAPGYPLFLYSSDNTSYNTLYGNMKRWSSLELDESDMQIVDKFVREKIYEEIFKIHRKEKKGDEDFEVWVRNVELDRRMYFKFEAWRN